MPVIINEFDVSTEPSGQAAAAPPAQGAPSGATGLEPQDIEKLMRFFESRRDRLVAD